MRYERVKDVVRLAMRLQGARGGLTLDDIRTEFSISRRSACATRWMKRSDR